MKNAIVAFFNLAKRRAQLAAARKPAFFERWFGIASCDDAARCFFNGLLSRENASDLVDFLLQQVDGGATIVTWNGLHFDFDILAEESGRRADCQALAHDHVDLMFHVFCEKGFCVGLDAAARAIGLPGKPTGICAVMAPQLWASGETAKVLDYVARTAA